MKTITGVTIYRCDHCNKAYRHKGHARKHEERCSSNPENQSACLGCPYLQKRQIAYGRDYCYGESQEEVANTFFCPVKEVFMMHPKTKPYQDSIKTVRCGSKRVGQIPMPKTCMCTSEEIAQYEIDCEELPF